MGKYKINIDKPTPSKEQTKKFKNFDNVVSEYKTLHSPWQILKGLYKDKKIMRIFIVAMAVLIAVFFGAKQAEKTDKSASPVEVNK